MKKQITPGHICKHPVWFTTPTLIGLSLVFAPPMSRADNVYVANIGDYTDSIEQFNSAGSGSLFASGIDGWALAFDSAGNLYGSSGSTIEKITPGGSASAFATLGTGFAAGMAFAPNGNLFVSTYSTDMIYEITPGGVVSVFANAGSANPSGLAFDSAGNLYVAYSYTDTIEKFAANSNVGTVFATTGEDGPFGLAFDANGNLYAAINGHNEIAEFNSQGNMSVFLQGPLPAGNNSDLDGPMGLAFDSSDNLYVVNNPANSIEKITPAKVASVFANTDMDSPEFLAIQPGLPVPEPSGIALAGLGFAMLLWRRRQL
jgi:sugar lactone lactonase YvrE